MHTPADRSPGPVPEAYEERVALAHFVHTITRYRNVIALSLAGVVIAYVLVVSLALLLFPSRRITSSQFRLNFDGESGKYPNGTRFTTADITSTPVLQKVHASNNLGDYLTLSEFSRSLFILQANREYEDLAREYGARLSDPKLNAVDRERIEREYKDKLAGIGKFDYSINFMLRDRTKTVPRAVVQKVLGDILSEWAHQAEREKKVLDYGVPVFSQNILESMEYDESFLRRLLLLRRRVAALMNNIEDVAAVPGATTIRTAKEKVSIEELRIELADIVRYDIDTLISEARSAGLTGSRESALAMLQSQLDFDRRDMMHAQRREAALRNALLTYESQEKALPAPTGATGGEQRTQTDGESLTTQLGDSFLDRLVDLANRGEDVRYRQDLTNEIKSAALAVGPAEATVQYDEALLKAFQAAPAPGSANAQAVMRRWKDVNDRVARVIQLMNEIYTAASRQLNAQSSLYTITSPPVSYVERALPFSRIVLLGVVLLLLAFPTIIGACLLHNRVREEERAEHQVAGEAA